MNPKNALKIIAACAIPNWATAVFAHDGHAMTGTHWHATDAWGFVTLGGLIVLAVWFSNKDR
jgi:hypothetical protein